MIDLEERESVRSCERWETGGGIGWEGRGRTCDRSESLWSQELWIVGGRRGAHSMRGERREVRTGLNVHQQGGDRERDARELSSWEQEADMGLHGSTTFKPILRVMYDPLTGRMEPS